MTYNKINLTIVLVVILLGVSGTALLSKGSVKTPVAIILGNPSELPDYIQSDLPTGYSWQVDKDLPFDITDDPKDHRALFVLDENTDKNSINEIMEWARENKKEEVYFFYHEKPDPESVVRFKDPRDILDSIFEIDWSEIRNYVISPFKIEEARADWLVPAPQSPCVNGCVPANWCINYSYSSYDDEPNDGRTPSLRICYKFQTNDVYRSGMNIHIENNIGLDLYSFEWLSASVIDCMKHHNGQNYIKRPVGLVAYVHKNLVNNSPCSGACGCASHPSLTCKTGCSCGGGYNCNTALPGPPPLKSYDGEIHIVSESCERNGFNRRSVVSRHELMHLYDFGHCHFDQNKNNTGHCIGLRQASCGNPSEISDLTHVWY